MYELPYIPVNINPPPMKPPRENPVTDQPETDPDATVYIYTAKQITPPNPQSQLDAELRRARELSDKYEKKVNGYATWVASAVIFGGVIPIIVGLGCLVAWGITLLF